MAHMWDVHKATFRKGVPKFDKLRFAWEESRAHLHAGANDAHMNVAFPAWCTNCAMHENLLATVRDVHASSSFYRNKREVSSKK